MAIDKNASSGSGGNYIKEAGEYRVKVTTVSEGKSKKGKPMVTVTFETKDGKQISSWFVKELAWAVKDMTKLKLAAGLTEKDHSSRLMDRELGIAVEAKDPDEHGKIFMRIVGYGKAADVESSESDFASPGQTFGSSQSEDSDQVPF